jgi:transcription initiation factor TFIIF subunit alpha
LKKKTFSLSYTHSDSDLEVKANKELKSVAEEDALRKLLTSDEDSDEEKSNKDEDESEDEKKKKADEHAPKESEVKAEKTKEKKKDDKKTKMQKFHDAMNQGPGTGHASDFSSDSDDSEVEKPSKKKKKPEKAARSSRSGTPVDATSSAAIKRKVEIANSSDNSNSPQSTPAKKIKTEMAPSVPSFSSFNSSKDNFGNTEEAVRRYLTRKPMTTTELLKKIQSKKTGVSSDELVEMMTAILKKINPSKQRTQGKMYLSLKPTT